MKVFLMHPDRDFHVSPKPVPNEEDLTQDLELPTLVSGMADGNQILADVARKALLSGIKADVATILYRQAILRDCLENAAVVRDVFDLATKALEGRKGRYWSALSRYPSGILYDAIEVMRFLTGALRELRGIADAQGERFHSKGFVRLFDMLRAELSHVYFASVQDHLRRLKFGGGILASAQLGSANQSTGFVLRKGNGHEPTWLDRLLGRGPPGLTYRLAPQDEAGARILSDIKGRTINVVANALAQSADHVLSFFDALRTELAFYVGCLNLRDKLEALRVPWAFPEPRPAGTRVCRAAGIYDVCLALKMQRPLVGNSLRADGKTLVIITGANQGGKSTFLRAVGLGQLMMQAGMFVGAATFAGELCTGLFTHYKREEDPNMKSGKLDEELHRMSDIADTVAAGSVVLFNESFASTNEREGSEIARQVVRALTEAGVKVFFVTHQYDFARSLFDAKAENALFLRAERSADGTRPFKLTEGEPLRTSFGEDLYARVFGVREAPGAVSEGASATGIPR